MELSEDIKDRCIFVTYSRRADIEAGRGDEPESSVSSVILCDDQKYAFIQKINDFKRENTSFPQMKQYQKVTKEIESQGRAVGEDVISDIVANVLTDEWNEIVPRLPISGFKLPTITITEEYDADWRDEIASASLKVASSFDYKLNHSLEWDSLKEEMEVEESWAGF